MIRGSCLCSLVTFEVAKLAGPYELCHCARCRKASGSAFQAMIGARTADFRLLSGVEHISSYEAPTLEAPPAYRVSFCTRCGSQVPNPLPEDEWFEIAAGLLDDDPQVRPDKHIFVELTPPWLPITDELPRYTKQEVRALRHGMRQK